MGKSCGQASTRGDRRPRRRLALAIGAHQIAGGDQQRLELGELLRRQPAERRGDQRVLDGDRLLRRRAPLGGEIDRILAAIGGGRAALDQTRPFEPVEQAGNVALGDVEPLGELLLADPLRLGQRRQHVALRHRQADRAQVFGDRRLDAALQPEEAKPDADRAVIRFVVGHASPSPAPLRRLSPVAETTEARHGGQFGPATST